MLVDPSGAPLRPSLDEIREGADHDAVELRADPVSYRRTLVETLVSCMRVTLALNDHTKMLFTPEKEHGFREDLKNLPYEALEKRIYAIQVQNPGVLAEAMKRVGFKIAADATGAVSIDVDNEMGGPGQYVTEEMYEAL